jgi:RNA-binding protein YlmH
VASSRLDCVVAAVCSLSRERARAVVESGLVELDFECEERADRAINPPCVISVRGFGRFKINSVSDKTKKGRYRLLAQKYL